MAAGDFDWGSLFNTGGKYYLGDQNIKDLQQFGRDRQEGMSNLATSAYDKSTFKPYTVTSGLGNVATDAQGGFNLNLSPEQEAMQSQLMQQAQGMFSQVGQDPAAQQAAIYEQLRATQRPEEQRQQLALEERMLSQGRLGTNSSAYGGSTPEMLAQQQAIQESMGLANMGARQQALAEQQQSLAGASGLMNAGYQPQQQALAMLQGSAVPAGFADVGNRTGTNLWSQLQQSGMEGRMQSEDMANQLRLSIQNGLLDGLTGGGANGGSGDGFDWGGLFGDLFG